MPSARKREGEAETKELITDNNDDVKEYSQLLSSNHWAILVFIYLSVIFSSIYLHTCLPVPLDPNEDDTRFSETRAIKILYELSNYGWKPAGSYNCEELTRNRILKELRNIKEQSNSDEIGVRFEIDTQYSSSCFDIPVHDTEGMNICYRNVSNVIAKLGRKESKNGISVLLNCHYDSWPTSNAGSDDLSSCALMLELIRIYSKKPNLLKHDVVFLFNGAEESSLLAAHGFITQHRWRHDIRAFINLEASGSGGRELLFQAGPANEWLLNSYLEAAVHPHCSVIGQEVFQSGVYPGDTDYRIFRDHGRVPGLDLAFVQNGYWWHTEFDEAFRFTNGSLQRAGENVFSTLNHLLQSPYLEKPAEYVDEKTVFFDFLGMFVVIYRLSIAHIVNVAAIIVIVGLVIREFNKNGKIMLKALWNYILVILCMLSVLYAMTKMSTFTYGALRWYTRHWLAIVAYGFPTVWAGLSTQALLTANVILKQREKYSNCLEIVHLSVIGAILSIFTYYNIASGFLFTLLLIPIIKTCATSFGTKLTPKINMILTVVLSLPGCSMCIYTSEMLLSIFIPIMGRTSANPEPIVAGFVAFSAFAVVLSLIGLVARTSNTRPSDEVNFLNYVYIITGVILSTLTVLYVFASIWPSPFNYDRMYPTAKRTQFFHVNQMLYNRYDELAVNETRFYAISHDYRGAEDIPFVRSDDKYTKLQCFYDNNPYCEVPYLFPTKNRINDGNIRVRKIDEKLKFPFKTKIMAVKKKHLMDGGMPTIDYTFSAIGTGQMSIYVVPDEGWKVSNTSVSTPNEPLDHMFLYFTCSSPQNVCEWMFQVQIKKLDNAISDEKPLLMGVSSHYLHGPHMQSKSIKTMIEKIEENRIKTPSWTITASAWNVDQVYRYF